MTQELTGATQYECTTPAEARWVEEGSGDGCSAIASGATARVDIAPVSVGSGRFDDAYASRCRNGGASTTASVDRNYLLIG